MREFLLRGKRSDNGEWITDSETYIRDGDGIWLSDENLNVVTVIPETVGQFTGLTDKNGARIFEGDIVHCVSKLDSADMVVIFECGQFRMVLAEKYHEYQTNVGYYDINCFAKEVIGNIHDNPETMKARDRRSNESN